MAYRWETNQLTNEPELVIDGWENGISDSPELGVSDMRNINNDSIPGIACCNYKLIQESQTPVLGNLLSASTSPTNTVTLDKAVTYYTPITFAGAGLPTGITAGYVYIAKPAVGTGTSSATIRLADGVGIYGATNVVGITSSGTGTFASVNMGKPVDYAIDTGTNSGTSFKYYILDSNGRVWVNTNQPNSPYNEVFTLLKTNLTAGETGNGAPSYAYGNGICFFKKYLFVFRDANFDIYDAYGQETATPYCWAIGSGSTYQMVATVGSTTPHRAKWGQDDIMYITDGNYLDNIDTASATPKIADFALTTKVLTLPLNEIASCLEEPSIDASPGNYIYIGTSTSQYIYPWNKTPQKYTLANGTVMTTKYDAPLCMPEVGAFQMLNINKVVYILAGKRGNIYYTNGSTIVLFKSMPKQLTRSPYGLWNWGGIMSLNNNLCFGAEDTSPTGTVNNYASGCYAITLALSQYGNLVAGAMRYKNRPSFGTTNTTVLIPFSDGLRFYAGWYYPTGQYGGIDILDIATPTYYSNYESCLESDIIPIGTALQGKTFNTIEYKLDTPLVSGEKIRIGLKSDMGTTVFTTVLENIATSTYLPMDGSSSSLPIQYTKWIQAKAELQTLSGGSLVRLREIRIR